MSPSICFPLRLLSYENLWGFGFPSQIGTGHLFWNLEFPQDGKIICYSAACMMTLCWKSELLSSWTNKHLSGQMFSAFPWAWLFYFHPLPMAASQWVWRALWAWGELAAWIPGERITQVPVHRREEWHCCSERGREDVAFLRGEVGCECWGAEVQVLFWCGGAYIPFSPCWVLFILQQRRFSPALLFSLHLGMHSICSIP